MNARIVLVRPLYGENVGLVARAMANFGFSDLAIVNPECDWKGGEARSRAMHGKHLLLKAKKFSDLESAVADCSYAIATTAKTGGKRGAISLKGFAKRFSGSRAKVAVVFGPEPSGLVNEEIALCDFAVTIPSSPRYGTLNLGCAAAVVLYELFNFGGGKRRKEIEFEEATPGKKRLLVEKFGEVEGMLPGIDDQRAVMASFKGLLGRALLSEREAGALLAFLSGAEKGLGKSKKGG